MKHFSALRRVFKRKKTLAALICALALSACALAEPEPPVETEVPVVETEAPAMETALPETAAPTAVETRKDGTKVNNAAARLFSRNAATG